MIEFNVIIEKDPMTKLTRRAVNAAELAVLQHVHGEGAVHIDSQYELDDELAAQFDPSAELERLRARYKPSGNQKPPVAELFRAGAHDIARLCGVQMRGQAVTAKAARSHVELGESREKGKRKSAKKAN